MDKTAGRWKVGRTETQLGYYQFKVYRRLTNGSVEIYQYADTKKEADALAKTANSNGVLP